MAERQVWLVHMGRPGGKPHEGSIEFTRELSNREYVALGWPRTGDLSTLPDDREAFKDRFRQTHPGYHSERGLAAATGMLYQFVHGMRKGDIVVCPTPGGGDPVQIGEVIGYYQYEVGDYGEYHHLRKVKWLVAVPRDNLSEAAKGNLRVTRSLHPIRRHAAEFLKYL